MTAERASPGVLEQGTAGGRAPEGPGRPQKPPSSTEVNRDTPASVHPLGVTGVPS